LEVAATLEDPPAWRAWLEPILSGLRAEMPSTWAHDVYGTDHSSSSRI
jgi:hypothetical protein